MIIEKVLNNNVVTTIDKTGLEKVIMGRGIAFKKSPGEAIEEGKIEKIFIIQDKKENEKFQSLVNRVPLQHINLAEKIIAHAKEVLGHPLDEHIYVALTDHLSFGIKRAEKGLSIKNNLLWEIKRIYKEEYEIGLWAVKYINEELGINLIEDEAGFIALHIINAYLGEEMNSTMSITEMVQDILNIVKYTLKIQVHEKDLAYERFITHLKFFTQRILNGKPIFVEDSSLYEIVKVSYKEAFNCALKIKAYIETNYEYDITKEELVYLTLHIYRLMSISKKEE